MKNAKEIGGLQQYFKTLSIEDFIAVAKSMDCKTITAATIYSENGTEIKLGIVKSKSSRWKELKSLWSKKK